MKQQIFQIKLAERVVETHSLYPYIKDYCKEYLAEAPADFTVNINPADIHFERAKTARKDEREDIPVRHFSEDNHRIIISNLISTKKLPLRNAGQIYDQHRRGSFSLSSSINARP